MSSVYLLPRNALWTDLAHHPPRGHTTGDLEGFLTRMRDSGDSTPGRSQSPPSPTTPHTSR